MVVRNPLHEHRALTRELALALSGRDVYDWLVDCGYYPENFVLPPCFRVAARPPGRKKFFSHTRKRYDVIRSNLVHVNFPRSELTDRHFGIMHPKIHNDIAYHVSRNWTAIVKAMVPTSGCVVSYGFPVPLDAAHPGRVGTLRSGRMIYEYLTMAEDDVASLAYRYSHVVRTDIKAFYPSVYTHSIAWALHGKRAARKRLHDYRLLGNRLDKLFQYANDACTNGIPIGPVVSDIMAEIIAVAVDRRLSALLSTQGIECDIARFKDDYRMLAKSESDARNMIKSLQAALREFNLDVNEGKTRICTLPDGLFREWVSRYHAIMPRNKRRFRWKDFRELYLGVLQIDEICPGTGVIDRFLADIVSKDYRLRVNVIDETVPKAVSMLLLLGVRRPKAFPKVLGIIEVILRSFNGKRHREEIRQYVEASLRDLSGDEARNKYLIAWVGYFLVSNNLKGELGTRPKLRDVVTRSVFNNRSAIFKECSSYRLFEGIKAVGKRTSMLEHLDVFNPPILH